MDDITRLSQLAFQYGPFLFALLFNLVLVRWGHRMYQQACTRDNPPASDKEKNTYRLYFISMSAFGVLLVIFAIGWWFLANPVQPKHIFKGEIRGLRDYEQVASSMLYFRSAWLQPVTPDAPQIHHEKFIFEQDRPFKPGQQFDLWFSKGPGSFEQLSLPYSNNDYPIYQITWSETDNRVVVKEVGDNAATASVLLLRQAHADAPLPDKLMSSASPVPLFKQGPLPKSLNSEELMPMLQNSRNPVSSKIQLMEQLLSWDEQRLQDFLKQPGFKEPPLLIILDLTRHTDKELAYKARKVLRMHNGDTRFIAPLIGDMLLDEDRLISEQGKQLAQRVEQRFAEELLSKLLQHYPARCDAANIEPLLQKIRIEGTRVLVPTGTDDGDQYCIQIERHQQSPRSEECLGNFFTQIEAEQARAAIKETGRTWIFGQTKEWALWAAEQLEKCGVTTRFVAWEDRL